MPPRLITLLTDFGFQDAYVAQLKGQLLRTCPMIQIIDITHAVPPQDILTGALLLAQALPYFPSESIHIAVVDPGVGTSRRLLAVEIDVRLANSDEPRRQVLLLPDNGLITRVLHSAQLLRAYQLSAPALPTTEISSTFHGRDILAPAAARLAQGTPLEALGPACGDLVRLDWPEPKYESGHWRGQILCVDHFGNALTNLPAQVARELGPGMVQVDIDNQSSVWQLVRTYGQATEGSQVFLAGSHGLLELAVVCGNAAKRWNLTKGARISVKAS